MTRNRVIVSCVAMAMAMVAAQVISNASDEELATVEGTVTDGASGAPLARVHVTLRGVALSGAQLFYGAMTDASGHYAIATVTPGNFVSNVTLAGFVLPHNVSDKQARAVTLLPGEERGHLDFKLVPVGSIIGRVLDENDEPMEGAVVIPENGGLPRGFSQTDDKGQFRLAGLPPSRYRISAQAPELPAVREVRTDGTEEVHYIVTYYPGTPSMESAGLVSVRPGEEVAGIEIRMVRGPMIRMSGTLTGFPRDSGEINVQVLGVRGQRPPVRPQVNKDGTYEVWHMDPGRYRVKAMTSSLTTGTVTVEIGTSNVDHVDLHVIPIADVSGRVEFDGELAAGQQKSSNTAGQRSPTPRQIFLQSLDGRSERQATLKDDGTFTFKDIEPRIYRVRLGWVPAYVKSVRVGATETEGSVVNLEDGSHGAAISVAVGAVMGSVSGKVKDEETLSTGVKVALMPDRSAAQHDARFISLEPDNTFRFLAVPPGKYKLAVIDDVDTTLVMQIGLDLYKDVTETVEVTAREEAHQDLRKHQ